MRQYESHLVCRRAHIRRKVAIPHDIDVYKLRNRIERCFNRLKHFRRFAMRYDQRHPPHRPRPPRCGNDLAALNVDPA